MKNYLLFLLMCVIIGCGNDKKVEFYEEKVNGNVSEIHTYYYLNDKMINKDLLFKMIDSFDVKGRLIKQTFFGKEYQRDINNRLKWDENNRLVEDMVLKNSINYLYEEDLGLRKTTNLDINGKIQQIEEFTKINDTTISTLLFGLNKNLEQRNIIYINKNKLITSKSLNDRDSVLLVRYEFKLENNKRKYVSIIDSIDKNGFTYKHLKNDINGNWIRRKSTIKNSDKIDKDGMVEIRDIFYYKN